MADSKVKQAKDELSLELLRVSERKEVLGRLRNVKRTKKPAEGHSISQPENLNNDNNGL